MQLSDLTDHVEFRSSFFPTSFAVTDHQLFFLLPFSYTVTILEIDRDHERGR